MKFDIATSQHRHSALHCLAAHVVLSEHLHCLPFQILMRLAWLFKLWFVSSNGLFWYFLHFLQEHLVNQFAKLQCQLPLRIKTIDCPKYIHA